MEADRDFVANHLFAEGTSVQQDLQECLHKMLEHIDGSDTIVDTLQTHTCCACGHASSQPSTLDHIVQGACEEENADVQEMLNVQMHEGQYKCGTFGCEGDKDNKEGNYMSTASSMLVNKLPKKIIFFFKRVMYDKARNQSRNNARVRVGTSLSVSAVINGEEVRGNYETTYTVFHSSFPVEESAPGRSGYNVPDEGNPKSYTSWLGGHYFGAAVEGASLEFWDDDRRCAGEIEDLQRRSKKIVCVVLERTDCEDPPAVGERAQVPVTETEILACSHADCAGAPEVDKCSSNECSGLSCRLCSSKYGGEKADESWRICAACVLGAKQKTLGKSAPLNTKKALSAMVRVMKNEDTSKRTCHRVANTIVMFLTNADEAMTMVRFKDWCGNDNRQERVRALFRDACREIVMEAVACLWKIPITVHTLTGAAQTIVPKSEHRTDLTLSVLVHDSVVYPISMKKPGKNEIVVQTAEGATIVVAGARRTQPDARDFDMITGIVYALVSVAIYHGLRELLPPVLRTGDVDDAKTRVPTNKTSTYQQAKTILSNAGVCTEASKLTRTASDCTVIECSYPMMHKVLTALEMHTVTIRVKPRRPRARPQGRIASRTDDGQRCHRCRIRERGCALRGHEITGNYPSCNWV